MPHSIYEALKVSAIDIEEPSAAGFEFGFEDHMGVGLVQADAAHTCAANINFANGFE